MTIGKGPTNLYQFFSPSSLEDRPKKLVKMSRDKVWWIFQFQSTEKTNLVKSQLHLTSPFILTNFQKLFTGDKPQKLLLKHKDLNREMNIVKNFWDLDETSSLLHSMSLYNPFGIVDSLMSPLSAGGRVVLLQQFDSCKVSKKTYWKCFQ